MGEFIKTQTNEHIIFIGLDRGKSNALHLEMVQELHQEIRLAKDNPAIEALILHGKEGFFSSGLDLINLYAYDREQMHKFWTAFMDLIYELAAFPKPSIASITGHSPAGGCVLAICCDYRIMAEGDFIIGLNEIPVGITVPSSIFELYSFWLGQAEAYRSLLVGRLMNTQEALSSKLVDELVPADRVNTAATRRAKSVMQFDKKAWSASKLNLRQNLLQKLQLDKETAIHQVLEQWWQPSTRAILKTIIENLTKKKA